MRQSHECSNQRDETFFTAPPLRRAAFCCSRARTAGDAAAAPLATPREQLPGGLEVRGTRFVKDGKPFVVSGFNYWAGPTLAREGNQAGWDQVRRDLDGLQAAGINMMRVMAATEGPDSEPYRIVLRSSRRWGSTIRRARRRGALRRRAEAARALGIFTLDNFWQWSGGFAQYLAWAGRGRSPIRRRRRAGAGIASSASSARSTRTPQAMAGVRGLSADHRPEAEGQPDGDLGAGQRAARPDQRLGVSRLDRWNGAPHQGDGPGSAGHHGQRGADREPVLRGDGRRQGSPERRDRLHLLSHVGRELGLGEEGEHGERVPEGPDAGPRST